VVSGTNSMVSLIQVRVGLMELAVSLSKRQVDRYVRRQVDGCTGHDEAPRE
jgi:hypothetical protein